jgi:type III restriction enzyme
MLAEGWDAQTVTHIVGLRPFGSQLLCEQVVGRALRRKHYALNEETQMFAEETAKVFGVPFELIPFKVSPAGPTPPTPDPHHIYSVPEKAGYEITFPVVTGYHESGQFDVFVDWSQVTKVTIDPMRIPQTVELTPLTTPEGALAAYGPGEKPVLSLKEWRAMFRDQQVAFKLAREICIRWQGDNGAEAVPVQVLFPKVAFAAKRFLTEKLERKGGSQPCDVLLVGEYMQSAIGSLLEAIKKGIKKGSSSENAELAVIPQGAAGRGSTLFVDFHTTKPIYPVSRCHLNAMVADTQKWEQSAAFMLDSHPGVTKWVKNDRLGFFIPYRNKGLPNRYVPDFIVETDCTCNVIVEIKGEVTDNADVKAKAAQRWVSAVNRLGQHGTWHYLLVTDPGALGKDLNSYTTAKWDQPEFNLK